MAVLTYISFYEVAFTLILNINSLNSLLDEYKLGIAGDKPSWINVTFNYSYVIASSKLNIKYSASSSKALYKNCYIQLLQITFYIGLSCFNYSKLTSDKVIV